MKPKNMRNLEELIAIHESGVGDMSFEEARLLDLHFFKTTGEHLPEFEPQPEPAPPTADFTVGKGKRLEEAPIQTGVLIPGNKIPVADAVALPDAVPDAIPSKKKTLKPSESVS